MKISVVIPVFNSTSSLLKLISEFERLINEHQISLTEVIFVNDCSSNTKTWETLKIICKEHKWVKAINFRRNFGQQSATFCGISEAKGDFIFTMDDDMQHHPKHIIEFLKLKEHDVVIGKINSRKTHFLDKVTTSIKSYFDYKVLGKPKDISLSSYRMLKREIVEDLIKIKNVKPFISASIFHITCNVVNVSFEHEKRLEGKSSYTFLKRFKLFTLIIIDNSSILISLLRKISIYTFFFSILFIIYLLFRKYFLGIGIIGWTSTIVAILFLGSLNLLGISILGEYLSRLFPIIEQKQPYVVKERINFS